MWEVLAGKCVPRGSSRHTRIHSSKEIAKLMGSCSKSFRPPIPIPSTESAYEVLGRRILSFVICMLNLIKRRIIKCMEK